MRRMFVTATALGLAACAPVTSRPTPAAVAAVPSRAVLLEEIDRSRRNTLNYVDAAPDSMMTYRPVPGVRTFAEQIEHVARSNPFILSLAWHGRRIPEPADSATIRRDKAALRAFVNERYDAFARIVRESSDEQLVRAGSYAGITKPGWLWILGALDHATWTLGQTVPYLRLNGVKPPAQFPF